jgi:flagellar hook protein FlgE
MAAQFVDMVRFQRGYQAGSSIIKTVNEIVQQTIQIV